MMFILAKNVSSMRESIYAYKKKLIYSNTEKEFIFLVFNIIIFLISHYQKTGALMK